MFPGGTSDQDSATFERLDYLFKARKSGPVGIDRVAWIGGDLNGYGLVVRNADVMAIAMDCGHEHLSGRRTRHVVLSCEPCGDELRADAEQRLKDSAPLLAAILGARRWIAVIHRDTAKPHLHLVLTNFDEDRERRIDFRPDFLSGLQDMLWTPHLERGKGERVKNRGSRGKELRAIKRTAAVKRASEKAKTMEKLRKFLKKHKALDMKQASLVDWLLEHRALPVAWDISRLRSKSGKPRKYPAIVIDSVGFRIVRFYEYLKARVLAKESMRGKEI